MNKSLNVAPIPRNNQTQPVVSSIKKAYTQADVVKIRGSSNFDLNYMDPLSVNGKELIVVKEAVGRRIENKWRHTIIVYVFGNRLAYHHFTFNLTTYAMMLIIQYFLGNFFYSFFNLSSSLLNLSAFACFSLSMDLKQYFDIILAKKFYQLTKKYKASSNT